MADISRNHVLVRHVRAAPDGDWPRRMAYIYYQVSGAGWLESEEAHWSELWRGIDQIAAAMTATPARVCREEGAERIEVRECLCPADPGHEPDGGAFGICPDRLIASFIEPTGRDLLNAGTRQGVDFAQLANSVSDVNVPEMPYGDFLALEAAIFSTSQSPFGHQ